MKPIADVMVRLGHEVARLAEADGTAGILAVMDCSNNQIHWRLIGRNSVYRVGEENKIDVNYLGVVCAKLAQSVRTGMPSGSTHPLAGEVEWPGSILSEDDGFCYAFSGAKPDQDVVYATAAKNLHASL